MSVFRWHCEVLFSHPGHQGVEEGSLEWEGGGGERGRVGRMKGGLAVMGWVRVGGVYHLSVERDVQGLVLSEEEQLFLLSRDIPFHCVIGQTEQQRLGEREGGRERGRGRRGEEEGGEGGRGGRRIGEVTTTMGG